MGDVEICADVDELHHHYVQFSSYLSTVYSLTPVFAGMNISSIHYPRHEKKLFQKCLSFLAF